MISLQFLVPDRIVRLVVHSFSARTGAGAGIVNHATFPITVRLALSQSQLRPFVVVFVIVSSVVARYIDIWICYVTSKLKSDIK